MSQQGDIRHMSEMFMGTASQQFGNGYSHIFNDPMYQSSVNMQSLLAEDLRNGGFLPDASGNYRSANYNEGSSPLGNAFNTALFGSSAISAANFLSKGAAHNIAFEGGKVVDKGLNFAGRHADSRALQVAQNGSRGFLGAVSKFGNWFKGVATGAFNAAKSTSLGGKIFGAAKTFFTSGVGSKAVAFLGRIGGTKLLAWGARLLPVLGITGPVGWAIGGAALAVGLLTMLL